MSTVSRNKSQGIVVSFYHAIHAARWVQMPSEKREEVVSVSSATARRKPKKSLGLDWAENLVESNKGLFLRPGGPGAIAEVVERAAERRMRPVGFHVNINFSAH